MSTRLDAMKDLFFQKDASGTGIFSSLGLNAYNLEQEAKSLVPYLFPLTNSIPRVTSSVGGVGVNWKAVLSTTPSFITLPEAERAAATSFLEKDYTAPFKSMGAEVPVSWFGQETGRGFQDNQAFAQFSALNAFLTSQEKKILYGNSGPFSVNGGNGYALGTASTPTVALHAGGSIGSSVSVSARIVALTPYGMSVQNVAGATGLTPKQSATSMDGTTLYASGGTSIISAASNVVTTTSPDQSVTVTWTSMIGASGYAVYIDSTDASSPSAANAIFTTIVATNSTLISALPSGTNQAGNATGLNTDYSYDVNDFDGIMSWTVAWATSAQNSSTQATGNYAGFNSYIVDQGGSKLTANGDSTIVEFNTLASNLYGAYKTAPDAIWCSATTVSGSSMIQELTNLMLAGSSGAGSGAQRIVLEENDGTFSGGKTADAYLWPYSYNAKSRLVPIETHPWLPAGTILFQQKNNPYPQAAGKIPAAFELHALRDTFSIVWPFRKLQTEVGVYNFLATKNYLPHTQAIFQNVG